MPKISKEKFKVEHNVFDNFTNRTIFKLIGQHHFEGLASPIKTGKESNVFSAPKNNHKVIVKIYRLETCNFNKMYDYIKDDPRYVDLKGKKRKIIFAWVRREYRNLMIAREGGVSVPTPITFLNNIIVLEFIGKNSAAPQLKDAPPKNPIDFAKKIVENMKKLYRAGLVHADLSPFNILNFNEKPIFIDFSQTTPAKSTSANELLMRDIINIVNYFKKQKLILNPDKIKLQILKNH